MSQVGTEASPLRVAVVGAGPTGFYTADYLLKQDAQVVEVDMFERLPTPFGLVRYGVAPDHQKIKSVTKVYDRIAQNPRFRFYGNVELGKHISLADLRSHYHQIAFTTGAQSDRRLGIPGEDLEGSVPATEFVAWYNGHPDYRDYQIDLSCEHVVVIGVGNVAMDVARILCRTPEELAVTDIADYALKALKASKVKHVTIVGRRGPAQAAFTTPEIKELGELADTEAIVLADEAELDPLSQSALASRSDRATEKKVQIIQSYVERKPTEKSRTLTLRFLVSPIELIGDENGRVAAVRLAKNELYATDAGSLRSRQTDEVETVPAGLVFRSIGYRGIPLEGVPFYDNWGVILNNEGRVIDPDSQTPVTGEYTAGWIKRGPSGIIGTNKPDALETVNHMLADAEAGATLKPSDASADSAAAFVAQRQPRFISYDDWLKLDQMELARGEAQGRPRVKFTSVEEMLAVIGK